MSEDARGGAMAGDGETPWGRRRFLRSVLAGTGVAAVAGSLPGTAWAAAGAAPGSGSGSGRANPTGAREPWGRLEPVADGAWAMVSTPLVDDPRARLTLCNGGIVAGSDGVLVVEAFGSPAGAAWLAAEARRLTGRAPTHVVLTHYHGDHVSGGAGFVTAGEAPALGATRTTRRLMAEQEAALPDGRDQGRLLLMPDVVWPDDVDRTLELGNRTVRLRGRRGHTPSDLVVEVDDVVFAGDLVWNGMFPNYMDAIPGELARHVRELRDQGARRYISGHGAVSDAGDLDRYLDLLEHVEAAARRALEAGRPLEEAAGEYAVPPSLGAWPMFSTRYPLVAFRAWARELEGTGR